MLFFTISATFCFLFHKASLQSLPPSLSSFIKPIQEREREREREMERQRSFIVKPTRFYVFSFIIFSTLLVFFPFSFWVLKTTPSASPDNHLHFTASLTEIKARTFIAFTTNFSDIIVKDSNLLEKKAADSQEESPGEGIKQKVENLEHVEGRSIKDCGAISLESAIEHKDAILNHTKFAAASKDEILVEKKALGSVREKKAAILNPAHLASAPDSSDALIVKGDSLMNNDSFLNATKNLQRIERQSVCDVTDGRWVFDESYPLYTNNSCSFIDEGFSCESNGRVDRDYMKWRWLPHHCNIPRFNPVKMLELIRGKRLVFIGDSINRNQWESMLCLLRGAISDPSKAYEARGRKITKQRGTYNFRFTDYQCSVEYYVSHYLVHESKARVGQKRVKTLRIDAVDRGSSRWRGADILVFNTAHWWSHYKTKSGLNYYQEGDLVHPHLDVSTAFRKALTTWASWIDRYINPQKTRVFFRSSAPSHFSGGEWNAGGHCRESTKPLNDTHISKLPEKNLIVEEVVRQMRIPVTVLNITSLSGFRIDGHPSIYGQKPVKGKRSSVQDCSHWCLPGVPDTWNELLYYHLLSESEQRSVSAS